MTLQARRVHDELATDRRFEEGQFAELKQVLDEWVQSMEATTRQALQDAQSDFRAWREGIDRHVEMIRHLDISGIRADSL